ncbi:MAG TPA: hypothetical protein VEM32_08795 [Geobacteraceae bacterium]|nr:hypothetical protein [Geobacteraceae bacterium]
MDANDMTRAVLARFGPQIRGAVQSVGTSFGLRRDDYPDLRREAEILVAAYAGLMNRPARGGGRLAKWETAASGNEARVKAFLAAQLRIDLSQVVSRRIEKENGGYQVLSLEELAEAGEDLVSKLQEKAQINNADGELEYLRLRRLYPAFSRNVLDGYTQAEIAEADNAGLRTVERRIAEEKRAFLLEYTTSRGLVAEGDETIAELLEARGYLKASGKGR